MLRSHFKRCHDGIEIGTDVDAYIDIDTDIDVDCRYSGQGIVLKTNLSATTSMRAPGVTQSIFAMECIMDAIADQLAMSPVDVRVANFLTTVCTRRCL